MAGRADARQTHFYRRKYGYARPSASAGGPLCAGTGGGRHGGDADAALFDQDEEKALAGGLSDAGPAIAKAVESEDFAGAMKAVAALRGPVDAFFDKVTVNCDDAGLRENRLKLLNGIRTALEGVADFSKIEG